MSTTAGESVWVWDDLDKGTGFYGTLASETGDTVLVRVSTRCLTGDYAIGSLVRVPVSRVHFYLRN